MRNKLKIKSITLQLTLNIGLIILIICASIGFISIKITQDTLTKTTEDSMKVISTQAAQTVAERIGIHFNSLGPFSTNAMFSDINANKDAIITRFKDYISKNGHIDMFVTDAQGKGFSTTYDVDISNEDYFKRAMAGENTISDNIESDKYNKIVVNYALPIKNNSGNVIGVLVAVRDGLEFSKIIDDINYLTGYAFIINKEGEIVAHKDTKYVADHSIDYEKLKINPDYTQLVAIEDKMMRGESGVGEYWFLGMQKFMGYSQISGTSLSLGLTVPVSEIIAATNAFEIDILLLSGLFLIIGIVVSILIARGFKKPIKQLVDVANSQASGNFDIEVNINRNDELGSLAKSLKAVTDNMNELLLNIRTASDQVAYGAKQISDSSMELSQGATEQASSIEQLTASIEEISSQTKLNATNATNANELAVSAQKYANVGNEQMKQMLSSMDEINSSSNSISKIIKVIDDIAFQTNILALNAAVEAARAGQHGKGFAVVADEVRNLAARSANAAKETTDLIESSIVKVNEGTRIAKNTAEELKKILEGNTKVADLVNSIAIASNEQASGIAQINQGIMQVSQVVQQNSSTSQEAAAASEELSGQAELLEEQVMKFVLKGSENFVKKGIGARKNTEKIHNNNTKSKTGNDIKIALSDNEFGKY